MFEKAMIHRLLLGLTASAFLITGTATADDGHDDDNDAVKYRHQVMATMGSSFGAFILLFMNKVEQPEKHLVANARILATAAALTADLVPEGSQGGEALPAIWDDMDEYQKLAQEVADATASLAASAEAGDRAGMGKAFKAAGQSCKGCHDKFREEDD